VSGWQRPSDADSLSVSRRGARDYENTLRNYFGTDWPHFDLSLLGLGEEGHTASLFPGSPALGELARWVVAVETPADPPLRLTLTLPVIIRAAHTYVLVTGPKKATALHLPGGRRPINRGDIDLVGRSGSRGTVHEHAAHSAQRRRVSQVSILHGILIRAARRQLACPTPVCLHEATQSL
jgi:hypothetical protein